MARPVYSTLFIQATGLLGFAVYTVPSGFTAVVRDFDGYGNNTDPTTIVYLVDVTRGFGSWYGQALTLDDVGSPTHYQWSGRQVFHPGDEFAVRVTADVSAAVDVRVSGYLLTLP
jgi:hypothetical protein